MANALARRDELHTPVALVIDSDTEEIVELETSMFAGTGSSVTVLDSLSSTSATSALSAKQGKALNDKVATKTGEETLTNKTIDADDNTLSNIELDNLKTGVLQTTLRDSDTATDTSLATEKAVRTEIDKKTDIASVYPVGSVYQTIDNTKDIDDLATLFTGTWVQMGTNLTTAIAATGSITLDDNLVAGETITIGDVTLTAGTDFDIGEDAQATATAIAEETVAGVSLTAQGAVISVIASTAGEAGNDIALATDSENVTLSGANLTGGIDEQTIYNFSKTA